MAAEPTDAELELFDRLFANPTIEGMLEPHLDWPTFERFIAHVFQCAGYIVEHVSDKHFPHGPGVDLNLHIGAIRARPFARVEVRHYHPNHPITFPDVTDFVGILTLMGNVPGYLVTTSGFTTHARQAADLPGSNATLVDGDRLLRYITYIGGSRLTGQHGGVPVAPPQPIPISLLADADRVATESARPKRHSRVLALTNVKGGVAKTTTTLNVGFSLADADLHKQRVLLVDMDGQASLTKSLPRPPVEVPPPGRRVPRNAPPLPAPPDTDFLPDHFRGRISLQELVRPTRFPNLHLIPASRDLYRLQFSGAERTRAELQFVNDVRALRIADAQGQLGEPFDWIVLDTPASETFYNRAALAAADYILMPAFAEAYANQGVMETLALCATMGALMGDVDTWKKRFLGCLVTRWRAGPNANNAVAILQAGIKQKGLNFYKSHIPLDDRVETAHRGTIEGGSRNIFRLTPQMGPAAQAYDEFVEEMLKDVHRREAQP